MQNEVEKLLNGIASFPLLPFGSYVENNVYNLDELDRLNLLK